jgi:hypothetical protein
MYSRKYSTKYSRTEGFVVCEIDIGQLVVEVAQVISEFHNGSSSYLVELSRYLKKLSNPFNAACPEA